MKKVGLVTFFDEVNYGQTLQAYALSQAIDNAGYDCELINIPFPIKNKNGLVRRIFNFSISLMASGNPLLCLRNRNHRKLFQTEYRLNIQKRVELFSAFRSENMKINARLYHNYLELAENPPDYDAYVCGSDQIWNPHFAGTPEYFLEFASPEKRIAYAPSFGARDIPPKKTPEYVRLLSEIPALSCREADGVDLIRQLTGRTAVHVLDPTFLLKKEDWDAVAGNATNSGQPYILCYFLGQNTPFKGLLRNASTELSYDTVFLPLIFEDKEFKSSNDFEATPSEFVAYIKNARLVLTDSFHAAVFSIIYNTPFAVFERKDSDYHGNQMFSRITSLMDMCGLKSAQADEHTVFSKDMLKLDFTKANSILQKERRKSIEYLTDALKNACDAGRYDHRNG